MMSNSGVYESCLATNSVTFNVYTSDCLSRWITINALTVFSIENCWNISPFFPTLGSFLCFFILEAFKSCYRGHCCYYLSTFNRISHITTAHSLKIMPRNTFSTQRRKLQLDGLRCLLSLRMMNSALLQTFSCKYTRKWRLKETWRARLVPVRLVLAWFPMSLRPIVINEDF